MKRSLRLAVSATVIFAAVLTQSSTRLPRDTVEQFVKMDVEGERLTPKGWRNADALFVRQSEPLRPKDLIVIARHYAISQISSEGNKPQFVMGYEQAGHIDTSSLRFAPVNKGIETRSFDNFTVILIGYSREVKADNNAKQDQDATVEWKIDGAQPQTMHLLPDAAIRYVTEMRTKATDIVVRKNAEAALAALSRYR
jgi:hypothetical protein